MVTIAKILSVIIHIASEPSGTVIITSTLNNARNPIALDAVARRPDTGEAAPEYASGAARWNGAALTLKPNATSIIPIPKAAKGSTPSIESQFCLNISRSRLPDHR